MMQLDFIIEQLRIQEATNQDLMIAKGQWKYAIVMYEHFHHLIVNLPCNLADHACLMSRVLHQTNDPF